VRRVDLTFLPVIVVLVLLPLIAFASAPDPAWITGVYDGVDGDDIVCMVDDIAGLNLELPSALPQLHCSFHQGLVSRSEISSGFSSGPASRGPPRPSALISLHTAAASRRSCQVPVAAALLRETSIDHSGAPSPARPLRESASILGSLLANSEQSSHHDAIAPQKRPQVSGRGVGSLGQAARGWTSAGRRRGHAVVPRGS